MRVGRQSARTGTTTIILMPARLMGSTGLTTLWAAFLWEPVRGTTGDIRLNSGDVAGAGKAGVVQAGDAATDAAIGAGATEAEPTWAEAMPATVMWDVGTKAAGFTEAAVVNSTEVAVVGASMVAVALTEAAASMVAEAAKELQR